MRILLRLLPLPLLLLLLQVHLTDEESPVVGSGHGVDMALAFLPAAPGVSRPTFSVEEKAGACRAFFGCEQLGEAVQAVSDGLRAAIVRFAVEGAPGHFNNVFWSVAHCAQGDGCGVGRGGQMVISTSPHLQQWTAENSGGPARRALRSTVSLVASSVRPVAFSVRPEN